MNFADSQFQHLFSYGTLQRDSVQIENFGRLLEGHPDSLTGYRVTLIQIIDQSVVARTGDTHYKNVEFTGSQTDRVDGTVYKVTKEELENADEYEKDADYERVFVHLGSGVAAWVYLKRSE